MSDLDRLHELIDTLPVQHVQALLTISQSTEPVDHEEFAWRLAAAPREEVDEETVARILAAEAEPGERISHDELKRQLGL